MKGFKFYNNDQSIIDFKMRFEIGKVIGEGSYA